MRQKIIEFYRFVQLLRAKGGTADFGPHCSL